MKIFKLILSIATLTLTLACGPEFDTASAEQNYSYDDLQSQHQKPAKKLNADGHTGHTDQSVDRKGWCEKGGSTLDYCNGECSCNNCGGSGANDMARRCKGAGGTWKETA